MPSSSSSSLIAKHARAPASSERSGKERSEPERARVFFDQVEKEFRKATGAAWVWGYGEWTAAEALEAEHGADAVVERWRALLEHPDPWYVSARTMSALTAKWNALAPQTPQDEPGEDFLPEWARETSEPETPAEGKP